MMLPAASTTASRALNKFCVLMTVLLPFDFADAAVGDDFPVPPPREQAEISVEAHNETINVVG